MSLNHQVDFQSLSLRNPADWLMDVLSGVVPNDKLTDFRPAMLFDIWKSKKDGINRQGIFEHNSSSQVLQPLLWIVDTP